MESRDVARLRPCHIYLPSRITVADMIQRPHAVATMKGHGMRRQILLAIGALCCSMACGANRLSDMAEFLKRTCGVDEISCAYSETAVLSADEIEIRDCRKPVAVRYGVCF